MPHEKHELLPPIPILLGCKIHDPDPVLLEEQEFGRLGANPLVLSEDDEIKAFRSDDREPLRVLCTALNLGETVVTWVDNVVSDRGQRFPNREEVLVEEVPQAASPASGRTGEMSLVPQSILHRSELQPECLSEFSC